MLRTFLICPVRGHSQEETAAIVSQLESDGWQVYWPPRDTPQNDPTGLDICRTNRMAIEDADCVHVLWDGQSQGCLFDVGMAFALGKQIHIVGLPSPTAGKSFQNMIRAYADTFTQSAIFTK